MVFVNLFVSSVGRLVPYLGFLNRAMPAAHAAIFITVYIAWLLLAAYFWIFTPRSAGSPRQGFSRKARAFPGYGRIPVVAGYIILSVLFVASWPMAGIAPASGEKSSEYLDAEADMRAHLNPESPSDMQKGHELLSHVISLQREAQEEALVGYNQVLDEMKRNQVMVAFFAAAKGLLVLFALWSGAVLVAFPVGLEVLLLVMSGLVP